MLDFAAVDQLANVLATSVVAELVVVEPVVELAAGLVAERPLPLIDLEVVVLEGRAREPERRVVARVAVRVLQGSGAAWPGILRPKQHHPIAYQAERVPLHLYITRRVLSYLQRTK